MNAKCFNCSKSVYPTEKLKCLDKTWHKGCFKCQTCGLTLDMKSYKGYNKLPYCTVHYPSTQFTAVADTPENLRLAQTSKNQSSVNYSGALNREDSTFTAVADTPESLRMAKTAKQPGQVAYPVGPNRGIMEPARQRSPPKKFQPQQPPQIKPKPKPKTVAYIAVYDYMAADDDEVSFTEGDRIIQAEVIDEGWMTGTVERTGNHGMLPSNYVEVQE